MRACVRMWEEEEEGGGRIHHGPAPPHSSAGARHSLGAARVAALLLVLPALQLCSCAHAPTLSRLSCRSTRGPLHDEREANVPEALIKAAEGMEAGAKCEVRWQGKERYYAAKIRSCNEDGTFDVDYDDGEAKDKFLVQTTDLALSYREQKLEEKDDKVSWTSGLGSGWPLPPPPARPPPLPRLRLHSPAPLYAPSCARAS